MKLGQILIVASSDYLYTPRSLFWPEVIFLTAPNLDWGQVVGMAISVERVVNVDPEIVIIAGSNDHLQSRGLLNALVDGSVPSSEAVGEAIMTLLSAMLEAERSVRQSFATQIVKIIFVLSPCYALLPEPLQCVYAMVVMLAEARFDVMIPATNRQVDPSFYYPYQSERRLLKMRPGVVDEHQLVQQLANNLWFRQTDYVRNERGDLVRRNARSIEEDIEAMALRIKPHTNCWLYLCPRLCALGQDAFDHAPAALREIH